MSKESLRGTYFEERKEGMPQSQAVLFMCLMGDSATRVLDGLDARDRKILRQKKRREKPKQIASAKPAPIVKPVHSSVWRDMTIIAEYETRKALALKQAEEQRLLTEPPKRKRVEAGSLTNKYIKELYDLDQAAKARGDKLDYYSLLPLIRKGQSKKSNRVLTDTEAVANAKGAVSKLRRRLEKKRTRTPNMDTEQ